MIIKYKKDYHGLKSRLEMDFLTENNLKSVMQSHSVWLVLMECSIISIVLKTSYFILF